MTDQTHTHHQARRQIEPGNSRPVEPGPMKSVKEALRETDARRAAVTEVAVTAGELISIADTLGTAKTRCAALMMAAHALDFRDHEEAISFLAEDASGIIDLAIGALDDLRGEVQS